MRQVDVRVPVARVIRRIDTMQSNSKCEDKVSVYGGRPYVTTVPHATTHATPWKCGKYHDFSYLPVYAPVPGD